MSKEPHLFRFSHGYVGVYHLEMMHKVDSRESKWMRNWTADWLRARAGLAAYRRTGRPRASRCRVTGRVRRGRYRAHRPQQAHRKGLEEVGAPVETLYYGTKGHGFHTAPHFREFYTKLLDFLSRNIGGAKAK